MRSVLIFSAAIFTTFFSVIYINGLMNTFYYSQSSVSFPLNKLVSFIKRQIPEQSRIGSWDAGYIGYHVDRTVINLDGLVNNYEWLEYFQNGRLADYIVDKDIHYLANYKNTHWPEMKRIAEQLGWSKIYADTLEFSDSGRMTKFTTNPAYLDKSNRSLEFYVFAGKSE